MDKQKYEKEIKLMLAQNNTEYELYPLIANIIAPTLNGLSLRYVFARRRSKLGKIYYGISGFPDMAVLDLNFANIKLEKISADNRNQLKGCVEVKAYGRKLFDLEYLEKFVTDKVDHSIKETRDIGQLLGEILWYKKVLYTNGIKWKLFILKHNADTEKKIIEIVNNRKDVDGDSSKINDGKPDKKEEWWKDPVVSDIIQNDIEEQILTNDCMKNWDDFLSAIEKIKW